MSRLLLSAQAVFFVALGVCVALDARGLGDNHGWSYCEGRADTAVPYLMGLPARVAVIAYAAGVATGSGARPSVGFGLLA